jgi:hypothetical protein
MGLGLRTADLRGLAPGGARRSPRSVSRRRKGGGPMATRTVERTGERALTSRSLSDLDVQTHLQIEVEA